MIEMDGDMTHVHSKATRVRHWACACLISSLTFCVYMPVRRFQYLNFDDDHYITENPFVRTGLSWDNVHAAFVQSRGGHYHPLTWLSHMLDVSLFGLEPGPAHLVNAGLHAIATGLTFGFALRCTSALAAKAAADTSSAPPVWIAASVALLFGLHPLRLESVAWLAERKDVLSLNFALLTLHAWRSYQVRSTASRYFLVATLFAMGLLCKPTLVTLPVLLLALDVWLEPARQRPARLVLEKLPLVLLAVASVYVTTVSQHRDGALQTLSLNAVGDRVATAFVAYLAYFGKLFWPVGLGVFYPWVAHPPGVGIGAVCGVAALSWLCFVQRQRAPGLAFGWFWFLVAPLPVIGFVQFGGQAFADRWTYLPHLGLILGGCVTLRQWASRKQFGLAVCALALFFGLLTVVNLPHWRDSEALFRHTLQVAPNNFLAHTNLGNALDGQGKLAEATTHYEAAVRLNPTYPEALNNLGTARARTGSLTEAEQLLSSALKLRPNLTLARYNLGLVRSQLRRPLEAATTWLELLEQDPADPRALASLTAVLDRYLLPACGSNALEASPNERASAARAIAGARVNGITPPLREKLETLLGCLDSSRSTTAR